MAGMDDVIGSIYNDVIRGDGAANHLNGNAGEDRLFGGGGDDTVEGSTGDDEMHGEAGDRVLAFTGSFAPVVASLVSGTATGEGTDSFDGIEGLIGGTANDELTGGQTQRHLSGGRGNDRLDGPVAWTWPRSTARSTRSRPTSRRARRRGRAPTRWCGSRTCEAAPRTTTCSATPGATAWSASTSTGSTPAWATTSTTCGPRPRRSPSLRPPGRSRSTSTRAPPPASAGNDRILHDAGQVHGGPFGDTFICQRAGRSCRHRRRRGERHRPGLARRRLPQGRCGQRPPARQGRCRHDDLQPHGPRSWSTSQRERRRATARTRSGASSG